MVSILGHFGELFPFGKGYKKQILQTIFPCKMLCFLGLQLGLLKSATAGNVLLVNNSPILSMLFYEKVFKAGNEAVESAELTAQAHVLPKMEQPSEPTEEQEDTPREKKWYDDMSGFTSCYTQAAEILDRVLDSGDQPPFTEFVSFNCQSEPDSENPIPPEYEAGTEFLRTALKQVPPPPPPIQPKPDARPETHKDPPGYVHPPLTEKNLNNITQALRPLTVKHSRPYPYMKNPMHADPWSGPQDLGGTPLWCWDGCPDCEVWPQENESRFWRVNNWFENYFTLHDMYWGDFGKNPSHPSLKHPEPEPDSIDSGNIILSKREHDEDFLLGASDEEDFVGYKLAWLNEPQDTHQDICTLIVQYMQLGHRIDRGLLNYAYYYGARSNVILAQYEPRFLANVGFDDEDKVQVLHYPGIEDMSKPIWEARGCPSPMQGDYDTRMVYAKREYNRQWLVYRAMDDARQRYIQQVRADARDEYIQMKPQM